MSSSTSSVAGAAGLRGVILDADSLGLDVDVTPLTRCLASCGIYGFTEAREVAARTAGMDVVFVNKVRLDSSVFAPGQAPRLVCVMATGTNNVDLEAAAAADTVVSNVRGYATPSVVQHTLALMLELATRLGDYRAAVRDGRWHGADVFCLVEPCITELAGRTLGIVGYGALGQGVARAAAALDMRVIVSSRVGGADGGSSSPSSSPPSSSSEATAGVVRLPFEQVLAEADVLSLHCPLTAENRHLINAASIARMKHGAWLINTARGGLVDSAALVAALQSGRLGGAGVDVLDVEPPRGAEPLLDTLLPTLIVTPHNAWASREARQRLVAEMALNVQAFAAGTPRNVV